MSKAMQRDELLGILAENIRTRRTERGLSQSELARLAGVSQPRISQIESGESPTAVDFLAPLAEALGTTPDALLTPKIFLPVPIDRA